MDFPSVAGMVLRCKDRQPSWLHLLQGELSVLERPTGQAALSEQIYFLLLLCNPVTVESWGSKLGSRAVLNVLYIFYHMNLLPFGKD